MSGPLIPHTVGDVRDLYDMIVSDLGRHVAATHEALQQIGLECTGHLAGLLTRDLVGQRVLVLYGPDPAASLAAGRAAVAALPGLPSSEIPLTAVSEIGWAGRSLPEWVAGLAGQDTPWGSHGVVLMAGLESLRMRRGTYSIAAASGSTEDYRMGKSQNLAAMLSGHGLPVSSQGPDWDARRALVILTAAYDYPSHDRESLHEWGLLPELSDALAAAVWIRIDAATGLVTEREVRRRILSTERLYASLGYSLDVSPEAMRWVCARAAERGESAAAVASWIVEVARRRLIRVIESRHAHTHPIGPDDLAIPAQSTAGEWHD
jgi:hypothetical protein